MATKTSLLGLTKPAYTEAADIAVLNTNFDLIDKAVGNGKHAKNWVDNSFFPSAFVVNQRGMTTATIYQFIVDRWSLGKGTAELTAEGVKVTGATFRQPVLLPAGTYTFAVHLSNGVTLYRTFQFDGSSTITGKGGAHFTTDAYINEYSYKTGVVMVQFVQTDSVAVVHTVVWAALYEGTYDADTLPEYHYKGYAVELAECMRYYQQSFASNSVTNGLGVGVLIQIGTTSNCLQTVEYRVPMRIIPTVTIYSPAGTKNAVWNWQTDTDVGTNVVATYASVYGFTPVQAQAFEKGIPYAFHYTASADL